MLNWYDENMHSLFLWHGNVDIDMANYELTTAQRCSM